jgi:outer membrane protein
MAATRAEVLVTTDQAYLSVLRAAQRQTIAEEGRAVSKELLRAAEVRFRNGEVPALDVGRLELEVAQASTTVDGARADLAIARSELGTLIGLAGTAFEVEPLPEDEGPPSSESLDDIVEPALTARPEVKRLEAEVQALESAVGLAHGARLPQVHAEAVSGYDSLTLPDRQNAGWDAGLTVSIPLWDWNILARRERIARLEVEKARQRLAAARRAVTLEVTRRYLEADLAHRRLATTVRAERLAQRNAETARKGYGLGLLSSLELIIAQRQATAAASERAAAEFDQRLARSQLDFAAGRLR